MEVRLTFDQFILFDFSGLMSCFNIVESNMILRRAEATQLLKKDESLLSLSFPSLGAPDFTDPHALTTPEDPNGAGRSIFFPDDAIYSGHPRQGF
jgi:glutamate--cysteine ligase catalytic subunit